MRKLFLFVFFVLIAFCAKAQWQFTVSVKYSGQCAQYISQYGGNISPQTVGPFSTKSECESTRSQMSYSYNYSYGGYTCRLDVICSQCTGKDVENGSLTNSNTSPNIFGTSQGTSFSPSSAPDKVKQWVDDFLKKYDKYLSNVDHYTTDFDGFFGGGTFDDYVNGEYAAQVNNYENADRNELKEADKDSTYKYVFNYYDENGIPHFKEEKVEQKDIEFDEYGRPIFKGIKNENELPDMPNTISLDPPEDTRTTLQRKIDSLRKLNEVRMDPPVDETESTLGKILDKAGDISREVGDNIIEFDYGLASASYNAFGSVGTCGSTAMPGISLIDNFKEVGNDITSAINTMASSNMTATDVKNLYKELGAAAKKFLINTAKIPCGPLAPLLNGFNYFK